MTFKQAQINALKDNDLAGEISKIVGNFESNGTLRAFGAARLVAYLLKRVTQGEELINEIVQANENLES